MDEQQPITNPEPVLNPTTPVRRERAIKMKYVIVIAVIILLGVILYFMRGMVIAATVDGSLISRWSVIRESEKQAGRGALDFLIVKKLIDKAVKEKGIAVSDDEINGKKGEIEANISAQGQTLAAFLEMQGLTEAELNEQIVLQKQVEKLVADKVSVSDADMDAYIAENNITFPEGSDINVEKQKVKDFLVSQKQNEEIQTYIEGLRSKAAINYFIQY